MQGQEHASEKTIWVAIKHRTNGHGYWSLSPKDYFEQYGRIPDSKAKLIIPGMEEVMDHTYQARDGSDGIQLLQEAGIEILEHAVWYYQRPGYKDPEADEESSGTMIAESFTGPAIQSVDVNDLSKFVDRLINIVSRIAVEMPSVGEIVYDDVMTLREDFNKHLSMLSKSDG